MTGILDRAKTWMTPERAIAMQGLGLGLSQMAYNQPVNLSPAYDALKQRQESMKMQQVMQTPGIMDKFTPQQRSVLASMPEGLATKVIMESVFAPDPEPIKGVAVGGNLVNPITGQVIYEGAPDPVDSVRIVSGDEARALGLDPTKSYEVTTNPDGSLKNVSGIGGGDNIINMGPTGIDYGKPADGLVWARNADGTVKTNAEGAPIAIPYEGGPAWQKLRDAEAEAAAAEETTAKREATSARAGSVVLQDIGRVRDKIENAPWYSPAAGFLGNVLKDVAGTNAADVKALAGTIRANIGFDRLQQMREESPTGGALGQVAVQELQALQSVLGNLEQSQSETQLLENLDRLEKVYSDVMRKAAAYPNASQYGFSAPDATVDDDPLGLFK